MDMPGNFILARLWESVKWEEGEKCEFFSPGVQENQGFDFLLYHFDGCSTGKGVFMCLTTNGI